jgi:hypothetical protein
MRREWTDAIKNRRWDELERLAKWEPDQQLCDTIAELERGIADKPDRKALRKILFVLAKAGFTPAGIDEETTSEATPAKPLEAAFMMSADATGDTPITYGLESGGKFKWLTAYVNEAKGVRRASEDTMSVEDGKKRIELLRKASAPPFLSAEIDPAFALSRIKAALAKNRPGTVPEAIAFWRSTIDRAAEVPHPSMQLKAAKTKPSERAEDVLLMDTTMSWRIELGAATPIMERMYEAQQTAKDLGEDAQKEAVREAGIQARKEVLTTEIIAEHAMRLRDLAYLMHLKGDKDFGKVLAAAEELEKKGAESEYAKGLVDKTVVIYVETMKRADKAAS